MSSWYCCHVHCSFKLWITKEVSWSLVTAVFNIVMAQECVTEMVECQVLAVDQRGHGDTTTSDDTDLSAATMARCFLNLPYTLNWRYHKFFSYTY